jgi:hypothetical protein
VVLWLPAGKLHVGPNAGTIDGLAEGETRPRPCSGALLQSSSARGGTAQSSNISPTRS